MTTCLGKSFLFDLPRVPFVNCCLLCISYFPFGFECRILDLIVSDPDHGLSFYFSLKGFRPEPSLRLRPDSPVCN